MTSSTNSNDRKLMVASCCMFLIAGGLFATYGFIERSHAFPASKPKEVVITDKVTGAIWRNPATEEELAETLEYTKDLRERWRTWAFKHKAELKQLITANAEDTSALTRVYETLPSGWNPDGTIDRNADAEAGFGAKELIGGPAEYATLVGADRIRLPSSQANSPVWIGRHTAAQTHQQIRLRYNFANMRDIAFVESINSGPKHYTLWVSGRITEDDKAGRRLDPKNLAAQYAHREVVPPFEFL
jgi:hypothetical protein